MVKAGLIVGGAALVLGTIAGLITPLCIPCVALLAGFAGGYLNGQFERPGTSGDAAKRGAGAGAIGGLGALVAHLIASGASAMMTGPEAASELMRSFGLDVPNGTTSPAAYYGGAIAGGCCMGIFEIALMAAVGAVGGLIWYQMSSRNSAPPAPAM